MPHIEPYSDSEIDIATRAALACLLWQAGDMPEESNRAAIPGTWDDMYDTDDFPENQQASMRTKIEAFMTAHLEDLVRTGHVATLGNAQGIERIGIDYVLTTGRHGAGFWDRGYGEAGDRLTAACRAEECEWSLSTAEEWDGSTPGNVYCQDLED